MCLIVGLINPSLFNGYFKKDLKRKQIGSYFGIATLVLFIATASAAPRPQADIVQQSNLSQTKTTEESSPVAVSSVTSQETQPTEQASIITSTATLQTASVAPNVISDQSQAYSVVKVVDGDTIDVSINGQTKRIRLIGVNTPETVDPRTPVQCYGPESSAIAKKMLSGAQVILEADPSQGDTDKYSRLLRYVFLKDGTDFDKWLIRNGYGFEYTYSTAYKYQADFKTAQTDAQANKVGLWATNTCNGELKTLVPAASSVAQPASPTTGSTVPVQAPATVSSPTPAPVQTSGGHVFYVSSQAKTRYYCDTDPAWKTLSSANLLSYTSETALLQAHPSLTLHEPCQ